MAMAMAEGGVGVSLIFVYGTLKRGFYNHRLIDDLIRTGDAAYVGPRTTAEAYPLVVGPHGIPYLINLPGSGRRIRGELYSVSTGRGLSRLDELEGVDRGHYERLPLAVVLEEEEEEEDEEKKRRDAVEAYFAHRGFGEALWRRCGGGEEVGLGGLSEYSLELGSKYVRREDRPSHSSFLHDLNAFISDNQLPPPPS